MDRSSDTRPHKYERDRTQILNAEAWVLGFDMKIVRPAHTGRLGPDRVRALRRGDAA